MSLTLASPDGRVRAVVDPVGAGLRELVVDDRALVESYGEGERPPYAAGAVLFPWPNRVRDGRWSLQPKPRREVTDSGGGHKKTTSPRLGKSFR